MAQATHFKKFPGFFGLKILGIKKFPGFFGLKILGIKKFSRNFSYGYL
jgi:hypothetical protein